MIRIAFEHTYKNDLPDAWAAVRPEPSPAPQLLHWNESLANELGLDTGNTSQAELAAAFSGNQLPEGAAPIAQAYAGHQFGGLSPSLGDGRAMLLGEVKGIDGKRRDIAFKGSGRTPFSRRGDGKAAVGPMLRELIIGEAMHALGIPTTRALAVVAKGEPVYRERPLPGAILTRVASSHLRVGTFQYFALRREQEPLQRLADYTIQRHYPELAQRQQPYLELLIAVCAQQAKLIAQWMHVGFIHGVMNTDNMTLSGETIDYGPCAFMDGHNPATVFSSIDADGRYAYGNQPLIAPWNLARFAETLLPLISPDNPAAAIPAATEVIESFAIYYRREWLALACGKLGLNSQTAEDEQLVDSWHQLLAETEADHTLAWRYLADALEGNTSRLGPLLYNQPALATWLGQWTKRLAQQPRAPEEIATQLRLTNPIYIPRNHLVEEALAAASEHGDMKLVNQLLGVIRQPFTERAELQRYALPAPPELAQDYRTFCGT